MFANLVLNQKNRHSWEFYWIEWNKFYNFSCESQRNGANFAKTGSHSFCYFFIFRGTCIICVSLPDELFSIFPFFQWPFHFSDNGKFQQFCGIRSVSCWKSFVCRNLFNFSDSLSLPVEKTAARFCYYLCWCHLSRCSNRYSFLS